MVNKVYICRQQKKIYIYSLPFYFLNRENIKMEIIKNKKASKDSTQSISRLVS